MKHLLFIFAFAFSFITKAQTADSSKIIGIHTSVGKKISRDEKIKYNLFPEYKDNLFQSAEILKINDTLYQAVIHSTKGVDVKKYVSPAELDGMYYQIDDINKAGQPQPEQYALSEEERKKIRRQETAHTAGTIFLQVLGQVVLTSLQIIITAALTN